MALDWQPGKLLRTPPPGLVIQLIMRVVTNSGCPVGTIRGDLVTAQDPTREVIHLLEIFHPWS